MKNLVAPMVMMALLLACGTTEKTSSEGSTSPKEAPKPVESDWINLLTDNSAEGWRAYNGDALPPGWMVEDGVLQFDTELGLEQDYEGGKDIIYGAEEFDNFEFYVEWKLPEGGNSGIFYHLKEGYSGPPEISAEYQLIDDENYARIHDLTAYNTSLGYENPSELHPLQQTASDYAMYAANPEKKQLNPVGEWNSSKIVFTEEKVEYWLNDQMVLSFVPWSDDWYERKNNGKWKDFPDYAKFKKGYVGFQDHSSPIWFKNIKIKKL
ncbi:MAG: DUF1080 domain-containing protein [Cyclobacteriaceae bacterium]